MPSIYVNNEYSFSGGDGGVVKLKERKSVKEKKASVHTKKDVQNSSQVGVPSLS